MKRSSTSNPPSKTSNNTTNKPASHARRYRSLFRRMPQLLKNRLVAEGKGVINKWRLPHLRSPQIRPSPLNSKTHQPPLSKNQRLMHRKSLLKMQRTPNRTLKIKYPCLNYRRSNHLPRWSHPHHMLNKSKRVISLLWA